MNNIVENSISKKFICLITCADIAPKIEVCHAYKMSALYTFVPGRHICTEIIRTDANIFCEIYLLACPSAIRPMWKMWTEHRRCR